MRVNSDFHIKLTHKDEKKVKQIDFDFPKNKSTQI